MPAFFGEEDYRVYLDLMAEWCDERGVDVWARCLMPACACRTCLRRESLPVRGRTQTGDRQAQTGATMCI
jgi:hypothetical protein